MIPNFRAWSKQERRLILSEDILAIDYENEEIDAQKIYFEDGLPVERDIYTYGFDNIELMQSTGLRDKNGKEIFEGDVLTDGYTTGDIKHHTTYGFYMVDDKGIERWFSDGNCIEDFEEDAKTVARILEIVGNIWKHPELAEVSS